ncbi:MAG: (Fe-S)-binding protein [Proteobacteria bacterium]|nr:(Fe-S)-binding protein [Pseudomonadota bacterium]
MAHTALFVTCLVDQFLPEVGEAAVRLLEQVGCRVAFPPEQTCCGQPLSNGGFPNEAAPLARRFIEIFEPYEAVVTPSGSCASMVHSYAAGLLASEPAWRERAAALAARTFELCSFLRARDFVPRARVEGRVAVHPPCHLLRELGQGDAPAALLARVPGIDLVSLPRAEACCGFGGSFSVQHADLSTAMADDKLAAVAECGADWVASADTGCLLHLGGRLARTGARARAVHVAELLAAPS